MKLRKSPLVLALALTVLSAVDAHGHGRGHGGRHADRRRGGGHHAGRHGHPAERQQVQNAQHTRQSAPVQASPQGQPHAAELQTLPPKPAAPPPAAGAVPVEQR